MLRTGEAWWNLKDVCGALGLFKPSQMVQYLNADEVTKFNINARLGSNCSEPVNMVNESGLYKILLRSDKLQSREFRRWVAHEILTLYRRESAFEAPEVIEGILLSPDYLSLLGKTLKEEQEVRQRQIGR
ncbi:Bro-N domain-containing protein [Bifidobacterium sp. W8108]|uniref:BRO-N domain-containing protein n=1 Tax=unclassified Bifidobacterium TaxID=2608897 RepID=UPI0018DB0701|nr:Bro-N domain-containing protein [Bifidobacterium sp. W8108]MBI0173467.1 Bro-N domain-containing protein [Bifidobacterium sp. M0307]